MAKAKSEKSCGIICQIKRYMKAGASGRDKRIEDAVRAAEEGKATSKPPTLGNPGGTD